MFLKLWKMRTGIQGGLMSSTCKHEPALTQMYTHTHTLTQMYTHIHWVEDTSKSI